MRIVFMGTPDFAVPTLKALIDAGHEIAGAVTQPDKPKGRGKSLQPTPVKMTAAAHSIPVYQPEKVKDPQFVSVLQEIRPDVIVVVAFGQIIPQTILDIPPFGCINVHASLLPKYRGAAPVQWAVINGEKESGVTIMKMDAGLDTGDILAKIKISLASDETGGSLFDKLSKAGGKLCVETLAQLEQGTLTFTKQPKDSTTAYAGMINKTMGHISWDQPAVMIERLVRGLNPWPSAYTKLDGKTLKIWSAEAGKEKMNGQPGEIVKVDNTGLGIQTRDTVLWVKELQLEGKKRMETAAFLRGFPVLPGTVLG